MGSIPVCGRQLVKPVAALARVAGRWVRELQKRCRDTAVREEGSRVAKGGALVLQEIAPAASKAQSSRTSVKGVHGMHVEFSSGCAFLTMVASYERLLTSLTSRGRNETETGIAHAASHTVLTLGLAVLCWRWKTGRCHTSCFRCGGPGTLWRMSIQAGEATLSATWAFTNQKSSRGNSNL